MKNAYVSLVLQVDLLPTAQEIERIDSALAQQTRSHEIVLVLPFNQSTGPRGTFLLHGPISIVTTHIRSTRDSALIAGLARTVGDFVIEWRGPLDALNGHLIASMLEPTDSGMELVEATGTARSNASRLFNTAVNRLRPKTAPIRKTVGRAYSRRAVQVVLGGAVFEPQIDVLVAELPVQRVMFSVPYPNPSTSVLTQRISNGLTVLSKGSRFGSAIPLTLAGVSALIGSFAAIYAVAFLIIRGQTPEGWTSLMVLIGLGQATILTMLGLTWMRVDSLSRGLARDPDVTAHVEVTSPTKGILSDNGEATE